MGYIIECYAPANHGKSTTIKFLCEELESMPNTCFEILYQDNKQTETNDVIKAYRRYGLLVFIISAGDNEFLVKNGYEKLKYACGGLKCDILICASTKNEKRQSERIIKIESAIEAIAKENGHWIYSINIGKHYNKEDENYIDGKIKDLRNAFFFASNQLARNINNC